MFLHSYQSSYILRSAKIQKNLINYKSILLNGMMNIILVPNIILDITSNETLYWWRNWDIYFQISYLVILLSKTIFYCLLVQSETRKLCVTFVFPHISSTFILLSPKLQKWFQLSLISGLNSILVPCRFWQSLNRQYLCA